MSDPVHDTVNLPGTPAPRGYSDATLARKGRLLALGGHVSYDADRRLVHLDDLVGQVRQTLRNLKGTLQAAGAGPEHLIKLTIHTPVVARYREELKAVGAAWREELGAVYPAMTLIGVATLFDEGALVEIDGYAVIPD